MISIADSLRRLTRYRPVQLASASWRSFERTNCSQMAAGIAMFAMLALLPLLMLMVSVLPVLTQPLLPGYDIRRGILHFAQLTISPVARRWLQEVLQSLAANSVIVDGFSFLAFAWAVSNAFSQLDISFNRIWRDGEVLDQRASLRQVVMDQFRRRRNAFLLLILALASFVTGNVAGRWLADLESAAPSSRSSLATLVLTPVSSGLISIFFLTLLYRWLTPGKAPWRAVLLGAVIASVANQLVRILVAGFVDATIGATNVNIGGPLALLLAVFLFVQNILIGFILVRQYTPAAA